MKIAITGKGGVGKTSLSAALALLLAGRGEKVLAVDADPQMNLATALGLPPALAALIVPIAARSELIEERTGAKPGKSGQVFKINPEVSDVAAALGVEHRGVSLVVLGGVASGGGGCACPENTFLRVLVQDLVLYKGQSLVMDMAAGFEHLGRATAQGADAILAVVEPGRRSIECAERIKALAAEIGVHDVKIVGNKSTGPADDAYIRAAFPAGEVIAVLPFSNKVLEADREGRAALDGLSREEASAYEAILDAVGRGGKA